MFFKTGVLATSSTGALTFTVDTTTPVVIDQTKLFLLIVEANKTIPDNVEPNGAYFETVRSAEIDLTANDPNVYYITSLFAILIEDNLRLDRSTINKAFIVPISTDPLMIGLSTIDQATLHQQAVIVHHQARCLFLSDNDLGTGVIFSKRDLPKLDIVWDLLTSKEVNDIQLGSSLLQSDFILYCKLQYSDNNLSWSTYTSFKPPKWPGLNSLTTSDTSQNFWDRNFLPIGSKISIDGTIASPSVIANIRGATYTNSGYIQLEGVVYTA